MRIISGESCDPRMCQTPVFFATSSGPTRTRMYRLDFIYEICRWVSKLWNLKQKLEIQNVVYEICRRSEMWNTRGSGFWYQAIPQILIFSRLGRDFDFDSWINMKLLQILIFRAGARTTAESASLSELTLSQNSSTDTTLTSYAEPIRLSHVLVHCCTPSLWW